MERANRKNFVLENRFKFLMGKKWKLYYLAMKIGCDNSVLIFNKRVRNVVVFFILFCVVNTENLRKILNQNWRNFELILRNLGKFSRKILI